MKQTFMESLQAEESNNMHLFANANRHQHSRASWSTKGVRRCPYHRLRRRWGRTWKQLRWNTGAGTMRAADQQWNFTWLHKSLTLLAFTIPKFGHYFLNFYTAYRLRLQPLQKDSKDLHGDDTDEVRASQPVWAWNWQFSCYWLGVTGLGTLPCYSKPMIQMSFR